MLIFPTLSQDPYFPHGNVDLQYAIDCDVVDEKAFKLTTNRRSYTFVADTTGARDEVRLEHTTCCQPALVIDTHLSRHSGSSRSRRSSFAASMRART